MIIEKLYKMKERNIKLIFEIPFCLYLKAFLNDEKIITYENEKDTYVGSSSHSPSLIQAYFSKLDYLCYISN